MLKDLLLPMFAMVLLTASIFVTNLVVRVHAVRTKAVPARYFKTFDATGLTPPVRLTQLKNHMDNLFQVPVLFYAGCLAAMALQVVPAHMVTLAWAYVGLRCIHTLVHTTYNRVVHRMTVFVLSNVALMVMWVRLVLAVAP